MNDGQPASGGVGDAEPVNEQELRAAYEAELDRISSADLILQTAVSLLNVASRRLGPPPEARAEGSQAFTRDLDQARDAIDAAGALMPILERRMPAELRPLRDALAQLQMAYARVAQSAGDGNEAPSEAKPGKQAQPSDNEGQGEKTQAPSGRQPDETGQRQGPGPAEASGRLWVPGR